MPLRRGMGTNYYWIKDACPHCGRSDEPLHIGKSSGGWCFSLHVIPDEGINGLEDWQKKWAEPNTIIENEYNEKLSPAAMLAVIVNRGHDEPYDWEAKHWYSGDNSESSFHASNGSERGPRGMLRHKLGRFCIGHGEGTWDLCPGEFS